MSQLPTSPLFRVNSYVNKLRGTLRLDMKLRSLFQTLDCRMRDQGWPIVFGGDREAYCRAMGLVVPDQPYAHVFRASDPLCPLPCVAPPAFMLTMPTPSMPNRWLGLVFRMMGWHEIGECTCRAFLFDADAFARMTHAYGHIGGQYCPPTFVPGSPYFRHHYSDPTEVCVPLGSGEDRTVTADNVQVALPRFFGTVDSTDGQTWALDEFHMARQLAGVPELNGVIGTDGTACLLGTAPGRGPQGQRNCVEEPDLRMRLVVAVVIDNRPQS